MSYKDCIAEIKAASGDTLKEEQVVQLLERLEQMKKAKKAKVGLENLDESFMADALEMANSIERAAYIEKRNEIMNILKYQKNLRFVTEGYKSPSEGVDAILFGSNRKVESGRFSIAAQKDANARAFLSGFVSDLEDAGVLESFQQKLHSDDVARELYALSKGDKVGYTGNTEAIKIAKVMRNWYDYTISRKNRAGANIAKRADYIVQQTHDSAKLLKAGFTEWRDTILPKLDLEETFGDMPKEQWNQMLYESYEGLKTGVHLKHQAAEGDFIMGFKGPSNLAKKMSQHRKFVFKDADSFIDYHNAFGSGSMEQVFTQSLYRSGRDIALLENLGTNPEAMLDSIVTKLRQVTGDVKEVEKLNPNRIRRDMDHLTGKAAVPEDINLYNVSEGIKNWNAMSRLGGALLSSFTDLPNVVAEMRYTTGVHPFEGYMEAFKALLGGLPEGEQKIVANAYGIGMEGVINEFHSRMGAEDGIPGNLSNLSRLFFKLSGLEWWTDVNKKGFAHFVSNYIGQQAEFTFDKLTPALQDGLNLYGIRPEDWELLRKQSMIDSEDGNRFLDPRMIKDLALDDVKARIAARDGLPIEGVSLRAVTEYKIDLETRVRTMVIDRTDFAILTPGSKEYAQLSFGTNRGTWAGEFFQHLMQFKSFSVAMWNKVMGPTGREVLGRGYEPSGFMGMGAYAKLAKSPDMMNYVSLIAQFTLFGYASMAMKDLAKGKTPRDPKDPRTILAAFAQGGGVGLYGDFIFGEYDRYGRSFLSAAAGPTFSSLGTAMEIKTGIMKGDDVAAKSFKEALNQTPFLNLFYTRTVLDYLILYNIQEGLNPGYLNRMEKGIMENNGQEFIIPPSEVVGQ